MQEYFAYFEKLLYFCIGIMEKTVHAAVADIINKVHAYMREHPESELHRQGKMFGVLVVENHPYLAAFSAKLDGSSHNETATDGEQETGQWAFGQSRLNNSHIWRQDVRLGIGSSKSRESTSNNVADKDKEEHAPVALGTNKARRARVELQRVVNNGQESEGEQYRTANAADAEIDDATNRDTQAGKDGRTEGYEMLFH